MRKVLKFGGTSVGSSERMRNVAAIIKKERANVTVLSAMSGTTDSLLEISRLASHHFPEEKIADSIRELSRKYEICIKNLLSEYITQGIAKKEEVFHFIYECAVEYKPGFSERNIVAQGEILTSYIFMLYLKEAGFKTEWLYAPEFLRKDHTGKPDLDFLKASIDRKIKDDDTFYITQGFICSGIEGVLDNLGRGGSDYSAALIGAAITAGEVQVWTDIDGMHNNDPRYVDNTYPIRRMSFDEAAELAYFGAKILHPDTIQPCKDLGIPVLLKNTLDPAAEGTRISEEEDSARNFHAVAAKDGITVIRIYSARMLMAYGFLRQVFEIFEKYRTPIDMITTSEVAVSLTIDSDSNLKDIVAELEKLGKIEVERENSIVCVVGRMEHDKCGLAADILAGVKTIPLKMISYGASHRSMAILIETTYKKELLQRLNDKLFTADA